MHLPCIICFAVSLHKAEFEVINYMYILKKIHVYFYKTPEN